jgi:hypothetical protein
MGTDGVRLFDKRLCDGILALSEAGLAEFVDCRLKELGEFSVFRFGFASKVSGSVRLAELVRQGLSREGLKRELVQELCFLDERMAVDSWGCFAEVFASLVPPGAISDLGIFPHQEEERFLLLGPEHVTRMLDSLRFHRGKLRIMSESDLARLESWRAACVEDSGRMVAYLFDS